MTTPTPEDFAAIKRLCLEYWEQLTKAERERNDAIHFQEQFAEDATALSRQCTELREQVEQLKRDKERLDWLDKHFHHHVYSTANEHTFLVCCLFECPDSRTAIDAAAALKPA